MIAKSYRCDARWVRPRLLMVEYAGHVPSEDAHIRSMEELLFSGPPPVALCFDLTRMRSFHRAQVLMHGHAFRRLGSRMAGIAIVGGPPAARFGAVTVSLLSKIPLQSFDETADAIAWLEALVGGSESDARPAH